MENVRIEKVATGNFLVLVGLNTKYRIFNGSMGMSGMGGNVYGIHNLTTGKITQIGSLQKAKKTVLAWIAKEIRE